MTYNTDNGITSATENVVIGVFVDIVVFVVCLKCRSACKAVLSEASVTRDKVPGVRWMGGTVCKTVPCYMCSLIRGTALQAAVQHSNTEGFALVFFSFGSDRKRIRPLRLV